MNKVNEKILNYIHRAEEIDYKLLKGETTNYEAHLARIIEIAKMIQLEE